MNLCSHHPGTLVAHNDHACPLCEALAALSLARTDARLALRKVAVAERACTIRTAVRRGAFALVTLTPLAIAARYLWPTYHAWALHRAPQASPEVAQVLLLVVGLLGCLTLQSAWRRMIRVDRAAGILRSANPKYTDDLVLGVDGK